MDDKHPSFTAPRVVIEPVRAVAHMEPYVQCWCKSGKKFKFCHFRREREAPVNMFEEEQKILKIFADGYCSYPNHDECGERIVKAHSVQRNGGLGAIAEKGHVFTVKQNLKRMIDFEGTPPPRLIGIGKASVFPGFCDKHDDDLFKPIESKDVALSAMNALLFAYRAISYDLFNKTAELKIIEVQRQGDRGQPLWKQAALQQMLQAYESGAKLGLRDIKAFKALFDAALLERDTSKFRFHMIKLEKALPIVGCGAFLPEIDFLGQRLQILDRVCEYEGLTMTITAFDDYTIASFGWFGAEGGPSEKLVRSLRNLPDDKVADALVRIAFEHSDNIYMRPTWWDQLSPAHRTFLEERSQSGTVMRARRLGDLVGKGMSLASAAVIDTLSDKN